LVRLPLSCIARRSKLSSISKVVLT
jgi:hypothetical protein